MYYNSGSCENISIPGYQVRDEADIYPLWEHQCGKTFDIADGQITVIHPGERNYYSGPDYKNCILKHSGGTFIHGDVEIHTDMKDWHRHRHSRHPEYGKVVLHVITRGAPGIVRVSEICSAPTIVLHAGGANYSDPCKNITDETGSEDLFNRVRQSAELRWRQLCDGLSGTPEETLGRFFKLISIRGNQEYISKLCRLFYRLTAHEHATDISVIRIMDEAGRSFAWRMGRRRPAGHPVYRIPFVSLLAGIFLKDRSSFLEIDFHRMQGFTRQLRQLEYPVPGIIFLTEMMGNVVYPLQEVLTGKDHFHHWSSLRVPPYAVVRQRLAEWKLTPDILSFELQQGILQIEKEYCRGRRCGYCPAGFSGEQTDTEMNWKINENMNKLIN